MNRRDFLLKTTRFGLFVGSSCVSGKAFASDRAITIQGRVLGGDTPLDGVLVSDGYRVARTDKQGKYELTVDEHSGPFLFVTTPRGYWTDRFYHPLDAAQKSRRADFSLFPREQPDQFDFVFITDMHLENRRWSLPKTKASLLEINALKPTPAFLLAQGDICLQGGMGDAYLELLSLAKMPVRNGAGNHEMMLSHKNPRDDFERIFGPSYYSFDWAGVHCIVLDGNKVIPGATGWKAVHGAVEGSEWAWLQADLAAQPKGKPIIVGVHIPIVSTYPERRQHSPKDAPYWEMTNDRMLTDLFAKHHVRLVLQGHMHENERITIGGVEYVESMALAGSWFQSGGGFERGVDHAPRGYRIVSVDGTHITHRYRSSCESYVPGEGEFVGLDKPMQVGRETEFLFNCFDAPNGSKGRVRLDSGDWRSLPPYAAVNKGLQLKMPHHFRLIADTTSLVVGRHTIEVEIKWPGGHLVKQTSAFMVGK